MSRTELNEEELRRHEVLSRVERKELTPREAAGLLRVSYAQAKRLRQRYRQGGAPALRHGNAGKRSNRAKPEGLREQVLELVRNEYGGGVQDGFGPTLEAEHLESDHGYATTDARCGAFGFVMSFTPTTETEVPALSSPAAGALAEEPDAVEYPEGHWDWGG